MAQKTWQSTPLKALFINSLSGNSQEILNNIPADFIVKQVVDDTRDLPQKGEKTCKNTIFCFDTRILPTKAIELCENAHKSGALVVSNLKHKNVIFHPEPNKLMAAWAQLQYPLQPKLISAVTGTNGKTSVAWFATQFMQKLGYKTASIGTLGVYINNVKVQETGYTSPTSLKLHEILHTLAEKKVDFVCLEASSHALALHRLDGVRFSAAGFTNLSQDHLDFHGRMETYLLAKSRLFLELLPPTATAVLPTQNPLLWPLLSACKQSEIPVLGVGSAQAELVVNVLKADENGLDLHIKYNDLDEKLHVNLLGAFQAENIAISLGVLMGNGVDLSDLIPHIQNLESVPGRMELIEKYDKNDPTVVVDFAHTPEALHYALKSLKPLTKGQLWCVFGAGGDRDTTKRPKMGEISQKLADFSVITDDNPRTEDAATIRKQIYQGKPNETMVENRAQAIRQTIENAGKNDIILLAGKGHETGQIIGKNVVPHDDKEIAINALKSKT